jgi:hypothetical protein
MKELHGVVEKRLFAPYEFFSQRDYDMRNVRLVVVNRENYTKLAVLRSISATAFEEDTEEGAAKKFTFAFTPTDTWTLKAGQDEIEFSGRTLEEALSAAQASSTFYMIYREQVFDDLGNKLRDKTERVEVLDDELVTFKRAFIDMGLTLDEKRQTVQDLEKAKIKQIKRSVRKQQEFTDFVQKQNIALGEKTTTISKLKGQIAALTRETEGRYSPTVLQIQIRDGGYKYLFSSATEDFCTYDATTDSYTGAKMTLKQKSDKWTLFIRDGKIHYETPPVSYQDLVSSTLEWTTDTGTAAPTITITDPSYTA